ncbi:MAG: aminotransferase class V-fold PLP-dependent enzyme [Flavobacteriales bacterium]|nr:aminotransferase class V-fold PLP-dependent enzyme [Flavobacteriales bacterium]
MNTEMIRAGIPILEKNLFLNSAGASIPSVEVNKVILSYLEEELELGGYALQFKSEDLFKAFYSEIARLINCSPENIAFASSATDAYGKALSSIPFEKDDVILTSDDDYVSNFFQFINLRDRYGLRVLRMPLLDNGDLNLSAIQELIKKEKPKLVALAHIPTNSGLIQDVEAVGNMCKEENSIYLVDACQSVGQIVVDVQKLQCDFLSVTGRKFMRGPRGTGFLYVSDRMLEAGYRSITMDGGGALWTEAMTYQLESSAKRFELWEKPYGLFLGFTEAVRYINHIGIAKIEDYNQVIASRLRENLNNIKGVNLLDRGSRHSNILTFRKEDVSQEKCQNHFQKNGLICGIGSRNHAVIDYDKKGITWLVRLSPHYFNTIDEMDRVAQIIEDL